VQNLTFTGGELTGIYGVPGNVAANGLLTCSNADVFFNGTLTTRDLSLANHVIICGGDGVLVSTGVAYWTADSEGDQNEPGRRRLYEPGHLYDQHDQQSLIG